MMSPTFKTILLGGLLCLSVLLSSSANLNYCLEVHVKGIMIDKGVFKLALYNSEDSFLKTPCFSKSYTKDELDSPLLLTNLPCGNYAAIMYQDVNNNGILDKLFSVPIEPYGVSNNQDGFPSFIKASFSVQQNKTISIKLKN